MDGNQVEKAVQKVHSWRVYARPQLILVLIFGVASGFPLLFTGSTLLARLTDCGTDIRTIGLFGLVGLPYTFKFLWAPLVDSIKIGKTHLEHRRAWLMSMQCAIAFCLLGMAYYPIEEGLTVVAVLALLIAIFSATQDIVIDALRVEMLKAEDQGLGAAMSVGGYRVGMLIAGAGALFLAEYIEWKYVFVSAAGFMFIMPVISMCLRRLYGYEEKKIADKLSEALEEKPEKNHYAAIDFVRKHILRPFVGPVSDFVGKRGVRVAICLLLFIVLFKLGDTMAGSLTTPFYMKELNFTKSEIAGVTKLFGFWAVLAGTAIGGIIVKHFKISQALLFCGILQLLSNFVFVWLANVGHDIGALTIAVTVENVTGGMGTAAFVAFMASLCSIEFTATQYAIFSALSSVGRTTIAAGSGFLVNDLGWELFFVSTAVMGLPGLILLLFLRPQLDKASKLQAQKNAS